MASKKMKGAALEQAMPQVTADKSTEDAPENDWEARGHLNTLVDAHEIVNNASKMAKVHKLAGRHMKAVRSIQDLKDHYNDKFGSKPSQGLSSMANDPDNGDE